MAVINPTQVLINGTIIGGTIDNAVIGGATPAAGTFTTLTTSSTTSFGANGTNNPTFKSAAGIGGSSTTFPWVNTYHNSSSAIVSASNASGNSNLVLTAQGGSAVIDFFTNANTDRQFRVSPTASAVNYQTITGSATTFAPVHSVAGSDANISMVMQPKGTGAFDIAAGSSGVNISNGGTVTALSYTSRGLNYTSVPALAIAAPTSAGGVQATATARVFIQLGTVVIGGTGYSLNDVLTVSGGTPAGSAATITVTGVSGGVITSISSTNFADYLVTPANPASVTGGTGSGATFNFSYQVSSTFTITNAGSGYVEQPTVTFSGGGGSGAAAYAVVGGQTIIKGLGTSTGTITNQSIMFQTPSGNSLLLKDSAQGPIDAHVMVQSTANGYALVLAEGSNANASLYVGARGAGSIRFNTQSTSLTEQMRVTNTTSAVNYVQVTGAATGGSPQISAQGSDATASLIFITKGSLDHRFATNTSATNVQFRVAHTAGTIVNYTTATGNIAGAAPVFSVQGSDADIPLVLQPKGTGALQAQLTDSTATGGNARGANAVDWQTLRDTAAKVASGVYSIVGGGRYNQATGADSITVGGNGCINTGNASIIVGGYQNANSSANHGIVTGGYSNNIAGQWAFIGGGYSNSAQGFYNYIGGGFTNSGTASSAVTTQSGTMNGTTAVTLSGSNANIKVGQLITGTSITTFPATYVAAISGTSLTLSQAASGSSTSTLSFFTPHGVVVGGGNNQATGSYSFIGGGGDAGTAANRNVASGDWSFVGGGRGNTASGSSAVVVGGGVFAGLNSIYPNTASGTASCVLGGLSNSATGSYATTIGGLSNLANGVGSIAAGENATTRGISGYYAYSGCDGAINYNSGTSQTGLLTLARQTTDATATVLTSNASAASGTNQVILPNNSAYYFKGSVVAGVTGGGNTKGWTIEGVIKRGANAAATSIVGTATVVSGYADAGAATWALTATADTTNGGLAITFTGQASTTIRCVAKIETTEMTY